MSNTISADQSTTNMDNVPIPDNLREWGNAEFMEGEVIQWSGHPVFFWTTEMLILLAIAISTIVFFIFCLCAPFDLMPDNPVIRFLHGHPTILLVLGLLMLYGLSDQYKIMKRMIYAMTNHRIVIVQDNLITSYYLKDIMHLSCKQKANGTGVICLRVRKKFTLTRLRKLELGCHNVKKVVRLLQELKGTK